MRPILWTFLVHFALEVASDDWIYDERKIDCKTWVGEKYLVLLTIVNDTDVDAQLCTGVLVKPQWVLTSAVCVDQGPNGQQVRGTAVLGVPKNVPDLFSKQGKECYEDTNCVKTAVGGGDNLQFSQIEEVIIDPEFNVSVPFYSAALVKLKTPAELNDYVQTVEISSSPYPDIETARDKIGHHNYTDIDLNRAVHRYYHRRPRCYSYGWTPNPPKNPIVCRPENCCPQNHLYGYYVAPFDGPPYSPTPGPSKDIIYVSKTDNSRKGTESRSYWGAPLLCDENTIAKNTTKMYGLLGYTVNHGVKTNDVNLTSAVWTRTDTVYKWVFDYIDGKNETFFLKTTTTKRTTTTTTTTTEKCTDDPFEFMVATNPPYSNPSRRSFSVNRLIGLLAVIVYK